MKKVMLFGALFALFASSNLYAATCTDTTAGDGYLDECAAGLQLELPVFTLITFPAAVGNDGSDLFVVWDGTPGPKTNAINICIGTNGTSDIDIDTTSANGFEVVAGAETVPYSLDLQALSGTLDLTTGSTVVLAKADADDLTCANSTIPLELGFLQADLEAADTGGIIAPFTDTVTITVSPN